MGSHQETCPLCGSQKTADYFKVQGRRTAENQLFRYLKCSDCESWFLSKATPPPPEIYTRDYYATEEAASESRGLTSLYADWIHLLRWSRAPTDWKGKKILDIGFGGGDWMAYLQKKAVEVHGLDPSLPAQQAARKRGLQHVFQGTVEENPLEPASYDIITANHCMEHVSSPGDFLTGILRLLKPGGWLAIHIPNLASWEAQRAREKWFHLDPPFHTCLWGMKTMRQLLQNKSFIHIHGRSLIWEYIQSSYYAWRKDEVRDRTGFLLTAPVWILWNSLMTLQGRSGVMEFWAQKPFAKTGEVS